MVGCAYFFLEKHVFVKHPSVHYHVQTVDLNMIYALFVAGSICCDLLASRGPIKIFEVCYLCSFIFKIALRPSWLDERVMNYELNLEDHLKEDSKYFLKRRQNHTNLVFCPYF